MRRAQEAERRHQHISRVYEQSQCENDRLKQLLDVNRIPFARVIPQAAPLSMNHPPIAQQHGAFTSTSPTTPRTTSPPPSSKLSPHSSTSADTALNDLKYRSSMSPAPSIDGSDEYDEQGGSHQMHEYVQSCNSHQPTHEMSSNSHAVASQPSVPLNGSAPAPATLSTTYDAQFGASIHPQNSNPVPDSAYPASSIGSNQSSSPTLVNASTGRQQLDPSAIKDHDQTGVDFILA